MSVKRYSIYYTDYNSFSIKDKNDNGERYLSSLEEVVDELNRQELIVNEVEHQVNILCKFLLSKGYTLDDFNTFLVGELKKEKGL